MNHRKRLTSLVAIGLAVSFVASTGATAATKTTKKKVVATKKTSAPAVTAATTAPAATTPAPAAGGGSGGKAVWGLEAESSEGYLPSSSNCAISCYQVFTSMAERLFAVDAKGQIGPWLADSIPGCTLTVYVL